MPISMREQNKKLKVLRKNNFDFQRRADGAIKRHDEIQ